MDAHAPLPPASDRMLFVRSVDAAGTMANTPLVIAGLVAVALAIPVQQSAASTRSLDIVLYSDGSAHVANRLDVDPLEPDTNVGLFGPSVDNLIALGEGGLLLASELGGEEAAVSTFGHAVVDVEYDIHDLVSKEGRVWTFALDSHSPFALTMPPGSIIVGMSAVPSSMDVRDEQVVLQLGAGLSEVNYIFGAAVPAAQVAEPAADQSYLAALGAALAAAGGAAALAWRRARGRTGAAEAPADEADPGMREDDKKIIEFISGNGGQAMESELRKRFLLPKTTMWRAIRRLERQGVIEVTKKEQQNLVKLREGQA